MSAENEKQTLVAVLAGEVLALAKATICEVTDARNDLHEADISYLQHLLLERARALHDAVSR